MEPESMPNIQKIVTKGGPTVETYSSYVGKPGEITVNGSQIAVHDGSTPGGKVTAAPQFSPEMVFHGLPGTSYGCIPTCTSADGSVIAGYCEDISINSAVWWDRATYTPHLLSGANYIPTGISDDGTVIVGNDNGNCCAWNIVSGQTTDLTISGSTSIYGISADGSTAIGADNGNAVIWDVYMATAATLGSLGGASAAYCISADKTRIFGTSNNVPVAWFNMGDPTPFTDSFSAGLVSGCSSSGLTSYGPNRSVWPMGTTTNPVQLPVPSPGSYYNSNAYSTPVSGDGLMTGGCYYYDYDIYKPCIYLNGQLLILPDVIPNAAYGYFGEVNAISRDGMFVVADGYDENGNEVGLSWKRNW